MGLEEDINKARADAQAAAEAAAPRVRAHNEAVSRVWADFLAYCRDFAVLAPKHGIAPKTGRELVNKGRARSPMGFPEYRDDVIAHPGGWVINQGPGRTPMFYITTSGALYVESSPRKRTGYLPKREIVTYSFGPCPANPFPWRFSFTDSPRMGCSDVVRADVDRLGGCVVLETPWEHSYAKDHILKVLSQRP